MIGNLGNAVKGIADKIKSFLHFSRPDEGPLREYEKWMPDMIKGLCKTLNNSSPELYNASKQLAKKVADGLNIDSMLDKTSYIMNVGFAKDIEDLPTYKTNTDIEPENIIYDIMRRTIENTKPNNKQHLSIYYMGKEIFDDTIDYINEKTRRTGKCVINVET